MNEEQESTTTETLEAKTEIAPQMETQEAEAVQQPETPISVDEQMDEKAERIFAALDKGDRSRRRQLAKLQQELEVLLPIDVARFLKKTNKPAHLSRRQRR